MGINAGYSDFINSTGSATLIGAFTRMGNNRTNITSISNHASDASDNTVRIGNRNIVSIGGFAGWTNLRDGRYKKQIKENVPGLIFINRLKPLTYQLDMITLPDF